MLSMVFCSCSLYELDWSPGVVVKFCSWLSVGTVRSLSALEGISSSAMKSLLIFVSALIDPLFGGSLSHDRLP